MKEISATEAARAFSALLDAVEHDKETFVVTRGGRGIARIEPASGVAGRAVKDLLRTSRVDPDWAAELSALRNEVANQERVWPA